MTKQYHLAEARFLETVEWKMRHYSVSVVSGINDAEVEHGVGQR